MVRISTHTLGPNIRLLFFSYEWGCQFLRVYSRYHLQPSHLAHSPQHKLWPILKPTQVESCSIYWRGYRWWGLFLSKWLAVWKVYKQASPCAFRGSQWSEWSEMTTVLKTVNRLWERTGWCKMMPEIETQMCSWQRLVSSLALSSLFALSFADTLLEDLRFSRLCFQCLFLFEMCV